MTSHWAIHICLKNVQLSLLDKGCTSKKTLNTFSKRKNSQFHSCCNNIKYSSHTGQHKNKCKNLINGKHKSITLVHHTCTTFIILISQDQQCKSQTSRPGNPSIHLLALMPRYAIILSTCFRPEVSSPLTHNKHLHRWRQHGQKIPEQFHHKLG